MSYHHQELASLIHSISSQVQTVPDDAQRNQMLQTLRTAGAFVNVSANHEKDGELDRAHASLLSAARNIGVAGKLLAAHGLKNSNFLYASDTANAIAYRYRQDTQR